MPRLACWSCGRSLYTVAPLESLFTEERRCPRCGLFLQNDRREADRRVLVRRSELADSSRPPHGQDERRDGERRERQRRGSPLSVSARSSSPAWRGG
jgi:hypothetical protein